MSQPSRTEMEKMQRDAEQRMREMQRRSSQVLQGNEMPPVPNFVNPNPHRQQRNQHANKSTPEPIQKPSESRPQHEAQHKPKGFDILKLLNFKNLKLDSDILLIVVLIFLLSTEETDELLMMALIYIML